MGQAARCLLSRERLHDAGGRDLIDTIADTTEPVKVFSVHDADGPGPSSSTPATRHPGARGPQDRGHRPRAAPLGRHGTRPVVEQVPVSHTKNGKPKRDPSATMFAREGAIKGESWEAWLQHSRSN